MTMGAREWRRLEERRFVLLAPIAMSRACQVAQLLRNWIRMAVGDAVVWGLEEPRQSRSDWTTLGHSRILAACGVVGPIHGVAFAIVKRPSRLCGASRDSSQGLGPLLTGQRPVSHSQAL